LCDHNTDFGINAEWHFFATSHGKGPCDGVGGTMKRLAAHSSFQHHQILTPVQFCSWAKEPLPSIHVQYICNSEVEQTRHHVKFRFDNTRTVVGTHQYHAFLPVCSTALIAKKYSKAQDGSVVAVAKGRSQSNPIQFEAVRGYVTIVYEDHWWPGCLLDKHEMNEELKITFFHPH
jgi:hypothetical protein